MNVALATSLAAAAALAGLGLLPPLPRLTTAAVLLAAAALAHARSDVGGRNALFVAALALITKWLPPGLWGWPVPAAILLSVVLVPRWRGERGPAAWWRRGALDGAAVGWAIAIAIVSGAALVAWAAIARPDLGDLTAVFSKVPRPLFLAGGAVWACLNAFGEEAIFRGALTEALLLPFGPHRAVVVQAIAFGVAHWHGVPRGPAGVLLATIYGLMLGALRLRAGGLLAPWLAHVAADLVVLSLIAAAF